MTLMRRSDAGPSSRWQLWQSSRCARSSCRRARALPRRPRRRPTPASRRSADAPSRDARCRRPRARGRAPGRSRTRTSGFVRSRRRPTRRRRLLDRLRRNEPQLPPRKRRRRLPDARPRDGDERRGVSHGGLEPDEHGRGAARQHCAAVPAGPMVVGQVVTADRARGPGAARSRSRTAGFAATRPAASASRSQEEARGATA